MKVTISLGGRFHAFYLAKYLQDKGHLHKLVTSYPKFEVKKYGIESSKIGTVVSKEIIDRGWKKLTGQYLPNIFMCNWYDKLAAYQMPMDSDIYIIWSGFALHTIRKIRKHNPKAIIILERCSTHIQFQREILEYAYKFLPQGAESMLPSKEIIEKEQTEYELVDFIALPTNFTKKTFIDKGIAEKKLIVNPYGVDLKDFTYNETLKDKSEVLNILFVGAFCVRKGAKTFLKIVDSLKNEKNIRFQIVGAMEKGIEEKIAPYLNKTLFYQSSIPQKELNSFYEKSDVFLFPSYEEGMAYVTLQAMACGLTLVVSNNSGAGMVVEHGKTGFLFEPEESEKYVETILLLAKNKDLCRKIGREVHNKVKTGFTWEDYAERYIQCLAEITKHS
jgi:glycosyltransferase involved in cell wall biosynthesis